MKVTSDNCVSSSFLLVMRTQDHINDDRRIVPGEIAGFRNSDRLQRPLRNSVFEMLYICLCELVDFKIFGKFYTAFDVISQERSISQTY
jgi:hypothetical protein